MVEAHFVGDKRTNNANQWLMVSDWLRIRVRAMVPFVLYRTQSNPQLYSGKLSPPPLSHCEFVVRVWRSDQPTDPSGEKKAVRAALPGTWSALTARDACYSFGRGIPGTRYHVLGKLLVKPEGRYVRKGVKVCA